MNVKGKFYLRVNMASSMPIFWDADTQKTTTKAKNCSFFDTEKEATRAAIQGERLIDPELVVCLVKKDFIV